MILSRIQDINYKITHQRLTYRNYLEFEILYKKYFLIL